MRNKIALNTFAPLLQQIVTIVSGFILPRLILSYYGSQTNGLVSSVSQFLAIISFLDLGIGSVLRYNLYKPLVDNDSYSLSSIYCSAQKYFRMIAKILCCYIILLCFLYPLIVDSQVEAKYSVGLILVLSISLFAQYYFGQVNQILLVADQKSYISNSLQVIAIILNTVLAVFLMRLGASIHIVKLVSAIVFALKPVILSIYVKKHYAIDRRVKYVGEPIKQKWNGLAQHVSAVVLDQTDVLVLTLFSSLISVSIYSVYYMVLSGIKTLLLSMTNGIEAFIGSLIAKKDEKKLFLTFKYTEWIIHTLSTFFFSCSLVLIVPFVLVYTKGVNDADYNVPLFAILITIANAGHCLRLPYSIVILAAGHYKQTQSNYIIAASVNIIISIILVNWLGLIGVAIGTITGMLYQTIWMAWYTSRSIIPRKMFVFFKQLIVDVVTSISVAFLCSFFKLASLTYYSWVIMAIKCVCVAIVVIVLINSIMYRNLLLRSVKYLFHHKKLELTDENTL